MSDEYNSLGDYYSDEIQSDEEPSNPTPLKILDESRLLDDPLDKILVEIYKSGEQTLAELAEDIEIAEPELKRHLGELRLQGYLGTEYQDGDKLYFVRNRWETEEFPSGPVIPLVYQYNLLSDRQRLETLKEAIDTVVEPGDIVVDLGAGTGVLSHFAADTAEQVFAVEMDREVFEKGRKILQESSTDSVEYIRGDAREIDLPKEVDVIMCEMLDTALAAELQVPVMNHAIENLAKDDIKVIPSEAKTSAKLVQSDYEFCEVEFRLPHFEEYGSRESDQYSAETVYHRIQFDEPNSELVEKTVTMEATKSGVVNGIQLNTDVRFGAGLDFIGSSPWLNAPLNLPFDSDIPVEEGEEITVELSYELGGGLTNIVYDVRR